MAVAAEIKRDPRPGQLSAKEGALRAAFLEEVESIPGGDRLRRCIQCGTCSGTCPVSYAMDIQPRQLVAYFRAGDLESILRSRTIWICASCYSCTVRCPASIKVTDLIYALKRTALEKKLHTRRLPTYALAEEFAKVFKKYGRNSEVELVSRFYWRTNPFGMLKLIPMGWKLFRKGRTDIGKTTRIKGLAGLRKLIKRAEQMEEHYPQEVPEHVGDVGYGAVTEKSKGGGTW